MFNHEQFLRRDRRNHQNEHWRGILFVMLTAISILACGGAGDTIGEQELDAVNVSIAGLPQFVAPSATPIPTDTQVATDVQPPIQYPPGGYVTNTPEPGLVYLCNSTGTVCYYATRTPNGGQYSTPAYSLPGATSTPRPTFTSYPSATPCISSFVYYFGEEVFTDPSSENLTLGLALGNVRIFDTERPDQQIVAWTTEIRNIGQIDYVIFAPFQIYVAGINGTRTGHYASQDAADELGITLEEPALDGYTLEPSQSIQFDMFAYTIPGDVTALAYILDPYGNGFDGTIAGGNVAYWEAGDRGGCRGRIGADYTPQANLTPQPTATDTATPDYACYNDPDLCLGVMGANGN